MTIRFFTNLCRAYVLVCVLVYVFTCVHMRVCQFVFRIISTKHGLRLLYELGLCVSYVRTCLLACMSVSSYTYVYVYVCVFI